MGRLSWFIWVGPVSSHGSLKRKEGDRKDSDREGDAMTEADKEKGM